MASEVRALLNASFALHGGPRTSVLPAAYRRPNGRFSFGAVYAASSALKIREIDGKTVTCMLSDEGVADYQPLFDNARKLRELMSALHELSLQLVETNHVRSNANPDSKPAAALTRRRRSKLPSLNNRAQYPS